MNESSICRHHVIPTLTIHLSPIEDPGWILDIGGGGEGVIGQLCGERVISIDRSRQELADAPGAALKIVMDAADLQFLDHCFQTATAFFFFMFTDPQERLGILTEIHRVLKPDGRLLLWDVTIPPYPGGGQDIFVIPLSVHLPDGRQIETGYGCLWEGHAQKLEDFTALALEAGFQVETSEQSGSTFRLVLVR